MTQKEYKALSDLETVQESAKLHALVERLTQENYLLKCALERELKKSKGG